MKGKSCGSASIESSLSSDSDNMLKLGGSEDALDSKKNTTIIEHSLDAPTKARLLHRSSRSSSSTPNKKKKVLLQRPAWLAQAIENRLYSSAQSFHEYYDKETMEERVRMAALVTRWRLDRVVKPDNASSNADSTTSPANV